MPFLFIVIEIFFLAIKLLIGKFCKMPLFERGSHLQSLKPPVSDCPVSGTASPRQDPLWKLLFHSQRDVYHLLQAGQWLHQPLKAVTHVSPCALCALLSLPAESGSMILGWHGWKQEKPQLWSGQSTPGIPPPSHSCSCCFVTAFYAGLMPQTLSILKTHSQPPREQLLKRWWP